MKRKIIYTLICIMWTSIGYSQYLEFPDNNAVWKESHTTIAGPQDRYYSVCGDTIINSTQYSQVVELLVDGNLNILSKTYLGGIRQDGEFIYMINYSESDEFLLYDFSLEQGDQITLKMPFGIDPITRTVTEVETQMIEGKIRRIIHFLELNPCMYEPEYWIEGIGSSYGLLNRGLGPCFGADIGSHLLCFQYYDEYVNLTLIECFLPELTGCGIVNSVMDVESSELELSVYPNPASAKIIFRISQNKDLQDCNLKIYSANGKLINVIEKLNNETGLPSDLLLNPGFYIATLNAKQTERILAHATFVVK